MHERMHVEIYEEAYTMIDMEYRRFTRHCVSFRCSVPSSGYLGSVVNYAMREAELKNAQLDCEDGNEEECSRLATLQSNTRQAKSLMLKWAKDVVKICGKKSPL